ncbi:hypothetical protein D9756_011564 [Leucocoprinus leucothites]|uniref:Globin-sensor domain-containing protein n=1 Tax=Leucocoprinus leucothites TaxID=201217 RepID=A0A8H5CLJ6_9AGAR|nr:hypothetical protein D9756_011564 [Leucoagaricus leucothites]
MATLLLTTTYVLNATYVGQTHKLPTLGVVLLSASFFGAWSTMRFLADIFLVSGILALLSHREKIVLDTPRWIMDVKAIADAILVVILLALSMGAVGLEMAYLKDSRVTTEGTIETREKLAVAYASFLFLATVNIAVTSITLYVRARKSSHVNDHSHRSSPSHTPLLCSNVGDITTESLEPLLSRVEYIRHLTHFDEKDAAVIHVAKPHLVPLVPTAVDAVYLKFELTIVVQICALRSTGCSSEVLTSAEEVNIEDPQIKFLKDFQKGLMAKLVITVYADIKIREYLDRVGRTHTEVKDSGLKLRAKKLGPRMNVSTLTYFSVRDSSYAHPGAPWATDHCMD